MTQVIALLGFDKIAAAARARPFEPVRRRFVFVRHGETEGNRTRVFQVPHIPLNEAGEAQAARAATALAATKIGRLVASPMARAWRTASLIGAEHGVKPEADGALSERFYVDLWDTALGDADLDWGQDPAGCETLDAFVSRVGHSLLRILSDATTPGETVIVAHGGVLLTLCALTDIALHADHRRNAVPLLFESAGGRWTSAPL
jgi:broad specificity phosphatase PhoE